ncbi:hypothetical protein [Sabulicella glaciei]|uniref:Lipocalin-like domain-containing protein n=1 Tax=Sabulicella glaciei TaxID=2984948 RepID=A0ABT3P1L0_9PROT|nr:hypothetical protein [Roseococcus sp. MDT2-1-1]MCW8088309.1 hypothetical protein [Roseococcus sp. MDT2-1-1]
MTTKGHRLLGRWRITSMELWDAAFIDLLGSGYIRLDADGGGEFAFDDVQGEIDGHASSDSVHFTWEGSDEMDNASGDGDAQLEEDGSLTGEISFHRGDECSFTARRWYLSNSLLVSQTVPRAYRSVLLIVHPMTRSDSALPRPERVEAIISVQCR